MLVSRLVAVFNREFTEKRSEDTCLSAMLKFRTSILRLLPEDQYLNSDTKQFSSLVTAKLVAEKMRKSQGSMSRYLFYFIIFLHVGH